ncbi:OsmC family protein [mine drainage metagenome]|uniref:OsmC family protein n=1 Tax=mine drainage metagenome TaxID=410659 RepID=T1BWM0_9ZZZZ
MTHYYRAIVRWTGNRGTGTSAYREYGREHLIAFEGKPELPGSSDPNFRGDRSRYNPEELLVASLSACHMLWYLHLCAESDIVVEAYSDEANGTMETAPDGSGRFVLVTLHPTITIRRGSPDRARELHTRAHQMCFIANSVNFPVRCEPTVRPVSQADGQGAHADGPEPPGPKGS